MGARPGVVEKKRANNPSDVLDDDGNLDQGKADLRRSANKMDEP